MDSFTELLNKKHMGELILVILMIIYLVMGFKTPDFIANMVDNMIGKIVIILFKIFCSVPIFQCNDIFSFLWMILLFFNNGNTTDSVDLIFKSYQPHYLSAKRS
jgi:hypothetical protein